MLSLIVISGWNWLLPVALCLALALGLVAWSYRREQANAGLRGICAGLKTLGLLTLAACLLEPLWSSQRAKPGSNLFVILADNSQGLQIKDRGATQSRGEDLRALLNGEKETWPAKIDENFQVRRYYFDSRLQGTRDFSELTFDGRATSIGSALRSIADRFQGQPLGGVLLLTDGNATDLQDGRLDATGLPPVYPVLVGKDDAIKDVSLQKVTASQTAFEDAPVTIQADVATGGYAGQNILTQLLDSGGHKVEEKTLRARGDNELLPFHFDLKPEKPGISFYRLRAAAQDEFGQFEKPESSAEATLANNSRVIVASRGKGPYRILYVAGQPKWEFKFMNRALEEDDQVHLVSLIRVARREPKFEFKGRPGESSNPLFRGFDSQAKDEIAQYDQPVLVRLNTRDQAELVGGFPKTAEELYPYSAIVVDDLEAEFFTRDQLTLIQKFVSERGGGFLMMGGVDAFHEGKYDRTPVGDMLPVYLDHLPAGSPAINDARLELTKEGWLQPWARLRNTESEETKRLEAMPPMVTVNRVRELKPGASAIASVRDEHGGVHPALAVQRFGNGRVGALMIADMWHWGMRDAALHKDMDKAWRQLYRWLVADVPTRVDFQIETKRNDPNQAVLLQVRVRDKVFQPMDNVSVVINVRTVTNAPMGDGLLTSTNAVRLPAEPALTEPGLYEITYVPRDTGGYLAEAVATDSAGAEIGKAEAAWTADPAAEEFRSLKPNRALMEQIARQTKGQVIEAGRLNDFAASLPNRKAPVTESWTSPLWHRSTVFLFALACFIAEWGLRRWKGMI